MHESVSKMLYARYEWQNSLVVVSLGVVPHKPRLGTIHITTLAKLSTKRLETLSLVRNVIDQVRGSQGGF